MSLAAHFDCVLSDLLAACRRHYGDRLVAVAVFGSVGRGTPRPDSDLDVLVVVETLPRGRMARVAEFALVERTLAARLAEARAAGVTTSMSPVF